MSLREFDPKLCCNHSWFVLDKQNSEVCHHCGATCVRDSDGLIVEYDNAHHVQVEQ